MGNPLGGTLDSPGVWKIFCMSKGAKEHWFRPGRRSFATLSCSYSGEHGICCGLTMPAALSQ